MKPLLHENPNRERLEILIQGLKSNKLDALVCTIPKYVLLISGYWPIIGSSAVIITREGQIGLVLPDDESPFAAKSWASDILTFPSGSLNDLKQARDRLPELLKTLFDRFSLSPNSRIGYESGPSYEPTTYISMHQYGVEFPSILARAFGCGIDFVSATEWLNCLEARLTTFEVSQLRITCEIAKQAFEVGRKHVCAGLNEIQAALVYQNAIVCQNLVHDPFSRIGGFTYCMSGPNAANAYAAFQHSTHRILQSGETILIHCNSFMNGFWTDITRTYVFGEWTQTQKKVKEAVQTALQAGVECVRPGVAAKDVDHVVRDVMKKSGFEKEFKHGTGHGVGFSAIDHLAHPQIHPLSTDILEEGMVFNIEPAVYVEKEHGFRHCDLIRVTANGAEILTPFE